MSQQESVRQRTEPSPRGLLRRGVVALVLAVVANLVVTAVGRTAAIAPEFPPLSYRPVALFTALGVVGAVVVYALLRRVTARPDRNFAVVAAVVLVVSLVPDVTFAPTLPGATTAGIGALMLMHVLTAVICVAVLTDRYGVGVS
ncbi:DUF6069 family protein [Haloarculaceae archaeon H-GB2-1]|nr:DUF6069 family protein [Haloarculaceae archaeon H-GB1-1]MEA5385767.1 DUF6069 family protein [Haloarculaceae archaeon H-GB11]MEA5407271.1 DUF6069 family protein [Haloarculaceae archaeon H-GB2-1]